MANKRQLKKYIRFICGSIACECITAREFIDDIDPEKMNAIVVEVAMLQEQAVKNASFSFDKTPRDFESKKAYNKARRNYYSTAYTKLNAEFNEHIAKIVKEMNALLSDEQREINKKVAQSEA